VAGQNLLQVCQRIQPALGTHAGGRRPDRGRPATGRCRLFFDESENPYGYDAAYAYSKIQAWRLADREAEQLRRFFSLLGLEHYLGPLTDAGIDLKPYSEAQRKIKLSQLSQLCTLLYAQQKTAAWYSSIRQEATALRALQP